MDIYKFHKDGELTPEEILGYNPIKLINKTIKDIYVGTHPDRCQEIQIEFSDKTIIKFSYWATYADDGSMELEEIKKD